MKAGFALAALLLDDRALAQVAPALPPEQLSALRAELSTRSQEGGQEGGVAALLRVLQPELTLAGVNQLPPRMRGLLARLLPPSARQGLLADAPAPRPNFVLEEQLLRVLVRLARRASEPVSA